MRRDLLCRWLPPPALGSRMDWMDPSKIQGGRASFVAVGVLPSFFGTDIYVRTSSYLSTHQQAEKASSEVNLALPFSKAL